MTFRTRRTLILGVGLIILGLGTYFGLSWWQYHLAHVSTDDAYVDADVALVTPRVAGTVIELPVEENRTVQQGDLLARLDPDDYRLQLQHAEAALAAAEQKVDADRAQVRAADSDVALAEAELDQAQRDNARIQQLTKRRVVSTEESDRARTALQVAQARVEASRQAAERARAVLGIAIDAPVATSPTVRQATTARDQAALILSYTELRAPIDGVVATRTVQVGERVAPGQALMRVVPLARAYIEANFKETQLGKVRIGQPATVVADIYPDYVYHAVVDSLAPGTGAAFALLPPENATGNWIKVVQRLPVRVRLTEPPPADRPLSVGLSVVVTIDVSRTTGPLLVPRGAAQ
jgi:membrane fusion protein (multidrug efflux system)